MCALMDELLAEAHRLHGKSVAEPPRRVCESRMRVYTSCCNNDLHIDPQPVTLEKMMAFLVFQRRSSKCSSTLLSYIQGFGHHFDLTTNKCWPDRCSSKCLKTGWGVRCTLKYSLRQNHPSKLNCFRKTTESFPVTTFDNRRFMFLR